MFDLKNKVALVTGASSGMGKAIARLLGKHGARVIISSNDVDGCEKVLIDFQEEGIVAYSIPCDIAQQKEIDHLVEKAIQQLRKIDILVSTVGVAPTGSFENVDTKLFEKTMQINLQNAIYLTQKILPQMMKRKDGSIIYLASIAAVRGNKNIGLYGISKAGLVQLAKNLAVEYGPDNIRVNTISPGLIDTPFSNSLLEQKDFMKKRLQLTPLRRVGKPEEVASVALLLASKGGGFITGQNIIVDGGTTITDGN